MFRKLEISFRAVELPAYTIVVDGTTHRVIKLDNSEYLLIVFDKDGSIFDLRKFSFEFVRRYFERFGLYLECEPTSDIFQFEYLTTHKVWYSSNYPTIRLPKLNNNNWKEARIYSTKKSNVFLVELL